MLSSLFLWLTRQSPAGRRLLFPLFFDWLARLSAGAEWWTFMNYGYDDGTPLTLEPQDEPQRYCVQLYHRVASAVPLAGKDVLEVSSGRGGGAAYLRRRLAPRSVTGVDVAARAVAFCRRVHRIPGLRFLHGAAEELPLFDASVDVVVNVEASFCYANFERFLAEVRRVLRPGGHFLFADLRLAHEVDALIAALRRSGLVPIDAEDISAAVCRALGEDALRRADATEREVPWLLRGVMRTFVGAPGTRIPRLLADGRMKYLRFVLCKPGATAASLVSAPLPAGAPDEAPLAAAIGGVCL